MGFFIQGYEQGISLQQGKCTAEEYNKNFKELLKTAKYQDCVEWENGFYKAMLDYDLAALKNAFGQMKEQAEQKERNNL